MSPFEAQKFYEHSVQGPIYIVLRNKIARDHGGPEQVWVYRTDRVSVVDWDFCGGREVTLYTDLDGQCEDTDPDTEWQLDRMILLRDLILKAKPERLAIVDRECKPIETWLRGRRVEYMTDKGLVVDYEEGHKHVVSGI